MTFFKLYITDIILIILVILGIYYILVELLEFSF